MDVQPPRVVIQPPVRGYGISLGASWLATVVLMWRDNLRDSAAVIREGTSRYGHNDAGDLRLALIAITVEVLVAAVLLRPWSRPTVQRALGAFVLALVWSALSMVTLMHTGGIIGLHFLWTVALTIHSFVALVVAFRTPVDD